MSARVEHEQLERILSAPIRAVTARSPNLRMRVQAGTVIVSTPNGLLNDAALAFVRRELTWLRKHLGVQHAQQKESQSRFNFSLSTNDCLPLWFDHHAIVHRDWNATNASEPLFQLAQQQLVLTSKQGPKRLMQAKKILINGLQQTLNNAVMHDVRELSTVFNVMPRKVILRNMRTRWGSLGPNNTMCINSALLFAPRACLHYVVAHELAHLLERNHSARFWAQVRRACPGYEEPHDWVQKQHDYLMQMAALVF